MKLMIGLYPECEKLFRIVTIEQHIRQCTCANIGSSLAHQCHDHQGIPKGLHSCDGVLLLGCAPADHKNGAAYMNTSTGSSSPAQVGPRTKSTHTGCTDLLRAAQKARGRRCN